MGHKRKQLEFKDKDLWYFVGLITTDGNLSSDGRHIDITSKDKVFLEKLKTTLSLENKVCVKHNGNGKECHRIQFSNRNFYDFLLSIGLTPNKSLTLGELKVPMKWFHDFFRGVIDGDGCIRKWIHPSNKGEQWSLRVYSAASVFIHWLARVTSSQFLVTGKVHGNKKGTMFVLKYGKLAAKQILERCYYDGCLSLKRKAGLAEMCGASNRVWSKSKTLLCAA